MIKELTLIICIGGSVTAGYPLNKGYSYPRYLERMRNAKVLNLGVCGMKVSEYPLNVKADKIIIAPNWNDIVSSISEYRLSAPYLFGNNWYQDMKESLKKVRGNYLLTPIVRGYFYAMRHTVRVKDFPKSEQLKEKFRNDILRVVKTYEGEIYFVLLPWKYAGTDIYSENIAYGRPMEDVVIIEVAQEVGAKVINLSNLEVKFSDPIHIKSAEDNFKIAKEISKQLGGER